jgi:hypothetical protein
MVEQKVIITNSLSSLMAVEGNLNSKNPKTRTLRKLLYEEGEKIPLLWVPGHMRLPRNEVLDENAKTALEDNLLPIEKYSPKDLIIWIKTEALKTRKQKQEKVVNSQLEWSYKRDN